jgi:hypothetical protein
MRIARAILLPLDPPLSAIAPPPANMLVGCMRGGMGADLRLLDK